MGGQWLNFFDISFRVQSLALAVVILLIIDFLKNKKLPLRCLLYTSDAAANSRV